MVAQLSVNKFESPRGQREREETIVCFSAKNFHSSLGNVVARLFIAIVSRSAVLV
jgi:hypothetical protein